MVAVAGRDLAGDDGTRSHVGRVRRGAGRRSRQGIQTRRAEVLCGRESISNRSAPSHRRTGIRLRDCGTGRSTADAGQTPSEVGSVAFYCAGTVRGPTPKAHEPAQLHSSGSRDILGACWKDLGRVVAVVQLSIQRSRVQVPSSPPKIQWFMGADFGSPPSFSLSLVTAPG